MGTILIFWGVWLLCQAVIRNKSLIYYALSGLIMGISINIRSEYLLIILLLTVSILLNGLFERQFKIYLVKSITFLIFSISCLIPWLVFTNNTIGRPLFTSTNSGAVRYLGLGVLPNNPWGIIDDDGYVSRIAYNDLGKSPWSLEANYYFSKKYIEAINNCPAAFVKRIVRGWILLLKQGLYFPNLRILVSSRSIDQMTIDYINERLKQTLGLNVNIYELEKYRKLGIDKIIIPVKYYIIIFIEYLFRMIINIIYIILLAISIINIIKKRINHKFLSLVCISFICYLLFIAGFVQTEPRHTTIILPILLNTLVLGRLSF